MSDRTDTQRILISGAYGTKNLGDDKLLSSVSHLCRKQYESVKIIATSIRPEHTEQRVDVDECIHTIERSPIEWISTARSVDLVLFGGGSTLGGPFVRRHSLIIFFSKLFRIKTYYVANGIHEGSGLIEKCLLFLILNCVDGITVRDKNSKAALKECYIKNPIDVVPDPGIISETTKEDTKPKLPDEYILVCSVYSEAVDLDGLAEALEILAEFSDSEIVLFPFHLAEPESDLEFCNMIQSKSAVDLTIYDREYTIGQAEDIIGQANMVIAMRLHSMILSAQQMTPFVPISYDIKCDAFLDRLGIHDYYKWDNIDSQQLVISSLEKEREDGSDLKYGNTITQMKSDCYNILPKCESQEYRARPAFSFLVFLSFPIIILINILYYAKNKS